MFTVVDIIVRGSRCCVCFGITLFFSTIVFEYYKGYSQNDKKTMKKKIKWYYNMNLQCFWLYFLHNSFVMNLQCFWLYFLHNSFVMNLQCFWLYFLHNSFVM